MRSKDQKIFNLISHTVMILVTVMAVLPFVLVFLSSVTEENTLVLNGYSFFRRNSVCMLMNTLL